MNLYNWRLIKKNNEGKIIQVCGFKSFGVDGTNIDGKTFIEGKNYHCDGVIKYGPSGNGYHMALNLEDTLRFAYNCNGLVFNPIIAQVIASGSIERDNLIDDEYIGYYDLFSCSDLEIVKYLTREEIINYALNLTFVARERFLSQYKLLPEELPLFWDKNGFCNLPILTHQLGYSYEEARSLQHSPYVLSHKKRSSDNGTNN